MTDVCAREALVATNSRLTEADLRSLRDDIDAILKARGAGLTDEDAAREIQSYVDTLRKSAELRAGQTADRAAKGAALAGAALNQFKDKPWEAFRAILAETNLAREGNRKSVQALENGLIRKYQGDLFRSKLVEIDPALERLFLRGDLDLEIARAAGEIWAGRDPHALVKDGRASANAVTIAQTMVGSLRRTILDLNRRLVPIAEDEQYFGRTSHDGDKIKAAGFDKWLETFRNTFMMRIPVAEGEFYRIARNFYQDITADVFKKREGPADLGSLVSSSRAFVPKDADSWYAYNREYGHGNLRETFFHTLQSRAKVAALAERLGTRPTETFDNAVEDVLDALRDRPKERAKLAKMRDDGKFRDIMAQATGAVNRVANDTRAKFFAGWRAVSRMSIFGGSIFAQTGDIAAMASERRFQAWDKGKPVERGLLSSSADMMGALFKGGDTDATRAVGFVANDIIARMGEGEVRGGPIMSRIDRLQNLYFKANFMTGWGNISKAQSEVLMANDYALRAKLSYDKLPEGSRTLFKGHGIGPEEWTVIRNGIETMPDGMKLLTADAIEALPNDAFAAYKSKTADTRSVERIRDDLADLWRQFQADRIRVGLNLPGWRTGATLIGDSQPGTWEGEIRRAIAVAKRFSSEFIYSTIGRELYGYGANNIREAFTQGESVKGFIRTALMLTVMGYVSMTARDALLGREPRDPLDPRTMFASMARGGALGIYSDIVLGGAEKRWGSNLFVALLGPQASSVADVAELASRPFSISHPVDGEKWGASALRTAYRNTPGNNIFFIKPFVDYLFMNEIMDTLSPGYLRRMEKRVEQDTGAQYWLSPQDQRAFSFR